MSDKIVLLWARNNPMGFTSFNNLEAVLNSYAMKFPKGFDIDIPNNLLDVVKKVLTENYDVAFTVIGGYDDKTCLSICKNQKDLEEREANR